MTYGLLRVKDEARWIERAIGSIRPVCDEILVLDDHSKDNTQLLAADMGCIVYESPFTGIHEARDKDYLLSKLWELGAKIGDYVIMIDGDEALYPADVWEVKSAIDDNILCASMHIVYLWDREDQVRVDRWYREFRRPSLWRLIDRGMTFRRTEAGGHFHCSSAPASLLSQITPISARLLHFGYLHREDRIRKFHFYNAVDPGNQQEDQYRHMVIGDLYPATSVFRWAGPLELRPL